MEKITPETLIPISAASIFVVVIFEVSSLFFASSSHARRIEVLEQTQKELTEELVRYQKQSLTELTEIKVTLKHLKKEQL